MALAKRYQLNPAQMAIAWVTSRPFATASIVGATTLEQLEIDVGSADLQLRDELIAEIETIHRRWPNPAP